MGRYRKTRRIEASSDDVFRAFTDPAIVADWMEADAITDEQGGLDTAGSSYTLVIKGPWRFRMLVVRSVPPESYEVDGAGPLGSRSHMAATLTPLDDITELVVEMEWALPFGPIGRWLDRRFVEPRTQGEDDRELDRLVAIVTGKEAESPRTVIRAGRRARELAAEQQPAQAAVVEHQG